MNGGTAAPPAPMTREQLSQNGEDCNMAAAKLYGNGNGVAAAGYEIASALYRCTSHLAHILTMTLAETRSRKDGG